MKRFSLLPGLLLIYTLSIGQYVPTFKTEFKKNIVTLPLTYRSGASPIVEVMINGKGPYRFQFDTAGPGEARLDARLYEDWKLPVVDSIRVNDGSGRNNRTLPVVKLESIALGDFVITNTRAIVRNYNTKPGTDRIDGVIGLDFFENSVVELDFEKNQLIIRKGTLDHKADDVMPFEFEGGVPVLAADLQGRKIKVRFDTGNMGGLTFHSKDIPAGMMNGEPKVIGRAQTVSNSFDIKEAQLNVPIHIGHLSFENPTINLNDVLPHANMGIRFSKQMNVSIDVSNRLMKLVKWQPGASLAAVGLTEYVGQYEGGRSITVGEDGALYITRPGGRPLKLIEKKKDTYRVEIVENSVLEFTRNGNLIVGLRVSRDNGSTWETVKKI